MRLKTLLVTASVALLACLGAAVAADESTRTTGAPAAEYPADNTARNKRDRSGTSVTPQKQSNTKSDVDLTRRIRQAIVKDDALSTNAHNVKIVTVKGVVTLRGPVANAEEKASIEEKAKQTPGVKEVDNKLEITAR